MQGYKFIQAAVVAGCIALSGGLAYAGQYNAQLTGFSVTGFPNAETGAIMTSGNGSFHLILNTSAQTATYSLTFADLTSDVTMAHIHFGEEHVPGGIMVWLCQTESEPSPVEGTPFCPVAGGSVSGTITAASIVAIEGQNVVAGDFSALESALNNHAAYVNVHTVNFPAGEINGQALLVQPVAQHRSDQ
jgi:hypothetical protein